MREKRMQRTELNEGSQVAVGRRKEKEESNHNISPEDGG